MTAFYVDSYPNRAISLAENWTWLYNGISTTNTNRWPLVAIDKDGTVVGHISSYPIQVCHAAARYNAAWFVDLYVLPDYRAVGLANILWQEVMQAADIMLSISPNKVSLPMFLKSGWIDISGAYYFSLPLNLQRNQHFSRKKEYTLLGLLGYIWRILYATRASFHEQLFHIERPSWNLFEKYFSNNNVVDNSLQIVRDETFFRWRIEQCSIGGDIFIHYSDNTAALVRIIQSDRIKQVNILMLRTTEPLVFFSHITRWAIRHRLDRIVLLSNQKDVVRAATKWFPIRKHKLFFAYSNPITLVQKLVPDTLSLELIDSDLDFGVMV